MTGRYPDLRSVYSYSHLQGGLLAYELDYVYGRTYVLFNSGQSSDGAVASGLRTRCALLLAGIFVNFDFLKGIRCYQNI